LVAAWLVVSGDLSVKSISSKENLPAYDPITK
jgi:hypothetical protein